MVSDVNFLINEKSPYLQQHARNPVNWYPWGDAAFEKAKDENKPVFLSIGYSTCHWCHVMERESFEDQDVADVMNRIFVSIKVDREERPDLDAFYMNVCQMLSGRGGWPLNVILTPDRKPIFAFTYLPKDSHRHMMGIMEMAESVESLWKEKNADLLEQGDDIVLKIRSSVFSDGDDAVNLELLKKAYSALASNFDTEHGGFSFSPKFPTPHNMLFLLRYYHRFGEKRALEMVEKTFDNVLNGGIVDQIGGGFHRYSTDSEWKLPHFEKMLYDQAMILSALAEAYTVTHKERYLSVMRKTLGFLKREMHDEAGGFHTALDADSEGQEGRYYTWTIQEISSLLGNERAEIFAYAYGCYTDGNFHEEGTGRLTGRSILYVASSLADISQHFQMTEKEVEKTLEDSRKILAEHRSSRVPPGRDDKVLSDVNGLLMWALSKCYQATGDHDFLEDAESIAAFLTDKMIQTDGRILHRYRLGEAEIDGMLDDYAFSIAGFLKLYETSGKEEYLGLAISLQETLDQKFLDSSGGYFNTTMEDVPVRMREYYDTATPSGNSFEMENLLKLGMIRGSDELIDRAYNVANSASVTLKKSPFLHLFMIGAMDLAIGPSFDVVMAVDDLDKQLKEFNSEYNPRVVIGFHGDSRSDVADMMKVQGKGIFVCSMTECYLPVESASEALDLIRKNLSSLS